VYLDQRIFLDPGICTHPGICTPNEIYSIFNCCLDSKNTIMDQISYFAKETLNIMRFYYYS